MKVNGHWLISDFIHRDPHDDLHDIDCGRYLQALQELPQNLRQLLQDSDMHIELEEMSDGAYHVTKIIKKREPEYSQSSEHFFVFDKEGKRINLTEEEYDKLLGIKHGSDDVFENAEELQLSTLDSEFVAPRDVWDVIFDTTGYMHQVERLIEDHNESGVDHREAIKKLASEIYSADWFPYPQDKRLHHPQAKKIAKMIQERDLTKQELGALIGPKTGDKRPQMIADLRKQASKMKPGPSKAATLLKANKISEQMTRSWKKYGMRDPLPQSDRTHLWTMWREKNVQVHGQASLMSWQFETMLKAKLQRQINAGTTTVDQANERLLKSMEKLYQCRPKSMLGRATVPPLEQAREALPPWLAEALPMAEEVVPDDGVDQSWDGPTWMNDLPAEAFHEEDEWMEQNLLSGGIE